jgi:hypothetical protein
VTYVTVGIIQDLPVLTVIPLSNNKLSTLNAGLFEAFTG